MTVDELGPYLKEHWPRIKKSCWQGGTSRSRCGGWKYRSRGAGVRQLGIPTVVDRLIQQALHQVLEPIFDPELLRVELRVPSGAQCASGGATGPGVCGRRAALGGGHGPGEVLRPGEPRHPDGAGGAEGQRQAGAAADPPVPAGRDDGRRAGEAAQEGTPQGGPLSPLLSNILLDDLDKELERRGHAFCRYADDCNIYVRHAAQRGTGDGVDDPVPGEAAEAEGQRAKSAVDRPWKRKFLGYTMTLAPEAAAESGGRECGAAEGEAAGDVRRGRGAQPEAADPEELDSSAAGLGQLLPAGGGPGCDSRNWTGGFGELRCILWRQWKRPTPEPGT